MPNRILKDSICTSDNLDQLTPAEEVFWYRLLVQCDDVNHAIPNDPEIIRMRLYPLRLTQVSLDEILLCIEALWRVGLINIGKDSISLSATSANLAFLSHHSWQKIAKRLAPIVYARDGYKCCHCGTSDRLSIDHIIPLVAGGTNTLDNMQTLCVSCNSKKGKRNG